MRKIFIYMGVLVMVLAFAAPQSFADGRQQARDTRDKMMDAGQQDLAGTAMDIPVQDLQGNEIGQVVAVATRDNEDAYYLVALNGSKGELTPIPFSAARFDPEANKVILLDVEDSELAQAPAISRDEMQKPDDSEFEREFRSYYGQEFPQQEESGNGMNSEEGLGSPERARVNMLRVFRTFLIPGLE